ncbi:MAG: hypothetical protein WC043_04155 [Pseudobdellovibrionaceae bacterium]
MASDRKSRIATYCTSLRGQLNNGFAGSDIYFLIYEKGEKGKAVTALLSRFKGHPASDEAAALIKFKSSAQEKNAFLGLISKEVKSNFGFNKSLYHVGFIEIFISDKLSDEEMFLSICRNCYKYIDSLVTYRPAKGPSQSAIKQPKQSNLSIIKGNLGADIFAVLQMESYGFKDVNTFLAKIRCTELLSASLEIAPEEHAYTIAYDVINHTLESYEKIEGVSLELSTAIRNYSLSQDILSSFEDQDFESWVRFVMPCQTMIWGGYDPAHILGAAIHTSPNPYAKAMAYLIGDITGISPTPEEHLPQGYNAFLDDAVNEIGHMKYMDEIFEMSIMHVLEADTVIPLLRMADIQNDALTQGKIYGWCADALQAAARAYGNAISLGVPGHQAARLEFHVVKKLVTFQSLKKLSRHINSLRRSRVKPTLDILRDWCQGQNEFAHTQKSIEETLESARKKS